MGGVRYERNGLAVDCERGKVWGMGTAVDCEWSKVPYITMREGS